MHHTHELIKEKYWLPNVLNDISKFIASCSICEKRKVTHHFPAGQLMPLPNPQCSWSQIAMDFTTRVANFFNPKCRKVYEQGAGGLGGGVLSVKIL